MSKYERDNDTARLSEARRVLEKMQKQLARTTAAHIATDEHLSKLTVDEASGLEIIRARRAHFLFPDGRPYRTLAFLVAGVV